MDAIDSFFTGIFGCFFLVTGAVGISSAFQSTPDNAALGMIGVIAATIGFAIIAWLARKAADK